MDAGLGQGGRRRAMGDQEFRGSRQVIARVASRLAARLVLLGALFGMAVLPVPAHAWGGYGHRVTAQIALANVSPETRAEIARLLRAAPQLATPGCDLASLEDAAVWPDCLRGEGWRWGYTLDRKRGVEGKSVSVRVDFGGGRSIQKKKNKE